MSKLTKMPKLASKLKSPKPNLIILPDMSDIKYFKTPGTEKSNNDEYNKIRENIITTINHLTPEYFDDLAYGEDWTTIRSKFMTSISTLCNDPFHSIKIKHMGGMSYNYDFILSFLDESTSIIKTVKLEFKHNNSNVADLVQFLELYDKDCKGKYEICQEMSYSEFYYHNFLDSYLDTDEELNYPRPDKDIYLRRVYDIKYENLFFKKLHDNKNNKVKEKKTIANRSVKEYLEKYSDTFKFDKITEKIKESQTDKVFLLWDCENFHIQILNVEDIRITGIIKKSDLYFDVNVENFQYNIRVRLNWGNSNGLCNPRWKFSFIQK